MRPITAHTTRTAPIKADEPSQTWRIPERAPSQPLMGSASEPRSGRYLVALAFSKAIFQRSRAASSAEFCMGGSGGLGTFLAQMYLGASLRVYLGEFVGQAAGV